MSPRAAAFLTAPALALSLVPVGTRYDQVIKPVDRAGFRNWRAWATAGARGRVLEIGAGTGLNFPHYEPAADVFAFDPTPDMLEAGAAARAEIARIRLAQASAEDIPFPAETFDAAVGTLVFCTIPNPARALAEIHRVLKPGATLRLAEHVRSRNRLLGACLDAATPLWKQIAGGCHLNRDTLAAVRAAGFQVGRVHRRFGGLLIGIEALKAPNQDQEETHNGRKEAA